LVRIKSVLTIEANVRSAEFIKRSSLPNPLRVVSADS
jgi:hypothetical protein